MLSTFFSSGLFSLYVKYYSGTSIHPFLLSFACAQVFAAFLGCKYASEGKLGQNCDDPGIEFGFLEDVSASDSRWIFIIFRAIVDYPKLLSKDDRTLWAI